jgi:predicted neuraminidase
MKRVLSFIFFTVLIFLLENCSIPTPVLISLSPDSRVAHLPAFNLTVTGTDFSSDSAIVFDGAEKTTTFIDSTSLYCEINPDDIATGPATIPVQIVTPGGGASNIINFTVNQNHTFLSTTTISQNTEHDATAPYISVDNDDELNVVWNDSSPGNSDIFFSWSKSETNTWTYPVNISNNQSGSWNPSIVSDSQDNFYVVWFDNFLGNNNIFFSQSNDEGSTWNSPRNISDGTYDSEFPEMVIDDNDNLGVVWYYRDGKSYKIWFRDSTDLGATWGLHQNISSDLEGMWYPDITSGSDGSIHVVWNGTYPNHHDIWYTRGRIGTVNWIEPLNVMSQSPGLSYHPDIAVDNMGTIHVFWHDSYINGLSDFDIHYRRSSDNGLTWSNSQILTATSSESYHPSIATDSAGNLNLVWQDNVTGNDDIYFSRSTDSGSTWSTPINLSNNTALSASAEIAVDSTGNIHVVWADNSRGVFQIFYCNSIY